MRDKTVIADGLTYEDLRASRIPDQHVNVMTLPLHTKQHGYEWNYDILFINEETSPHRIRKWKRYPASIRMPLPIPEGGWKTSSMPFPFPEGPNWKVPYMEVREFLEDTSDIAVWRGFRAGMERRIRQRDVAEVAEAAPEYLECGIDGITVNVSIPHEERDAVLEDPGFERERIVFPPHH